MVKACRYCRRYGRACGRPHTEATFADWGRSDTGLPTTEAIQRDADSPQPVETEVVDLVAALRASVDAATARRKAAQPDPEDNLCSDCLHDLDDPEYHCEHCGGHIDNDETCVDCNEERS